MKELVETRFRLRLAIRRGWLTEKRLESLLAELQEIKLVIGSILTKTKKS